MKGGADETIQISIHDKYNNKKENAVTLKFSDKKLLMSVDLNIFKGDVRNLLNELFTIDDFDRETTHSKNKFLMGLADHPARSKTMAKALDYASYRSSSNQKTCGNPEEAAKKINEKTKDILSVTTCQLEIELSEQNGNIVFTVTKYHRMKIRTTTCKNIGWEKNYVNGKRRDLQINVDIELFYPYLDFASSKPLLGGIDYIDYEGGINILKKGQEDNLFTFTVKNTIENLKQNLKQKSIMVDTEGELTTAQDETRKDNEAAEKAAKEIERAKINKEKEEARIKMEEEARNKRIEEIRLKNEKEEKRRAGLTPEQRAQEDINAKEAADYAMWLG